MIKALTRIPYIQAYGNLSDCTGHTGGLNIQESMLIRCGDTTCVVFYYDLLSLRSTPGLVDANAN